MNNRSFLDEVTGLMIGLVLLSFIVMAVIFIVALFLCGFFIVRYLRYRTLLLTDLSYARPSLYGEPVQTQLNSTFEYLLYKLEDATGLSFRKWPAEIIIGCLVITVGAGAVLGLLLTLIFPASAGVLLLIPLGIGAVTGLFAGVHYIHGWGHMEAVYIHAGKGGSGDTGANSNPFGTKIDEED